MSSTRTLFRALAIVLIGALPSIVFAQNNKSGNPNSGGGSGSNFSASDASYAEVAAIAYYELNEAAKVIASKTSAKDKKIILYSDTAFKQLTPLEIANTQIASMGSSLCDLANPAPPPPQSGMRPFDSVITAEVGSVLSGIAAIAQLFTPQSSSVSTSLNPDDDSLKADLAALSSEIIFPDLFLPRLPSEQSPLLPKGTDLCGAKWDPIGTDFYTLWVRLATLAFQAGKAKNPSSELKAALKSYTDFESNLMAEKDNNPSPFSRLLRAARLKALLSQNPAPVILIASVATMGGTTWSEGKTSFTEHTSFSGGVVVRYLAFQQEKLIASGTIARTLSDQKATDIKKERPELLNYP